MEIPKGKYELQMKAAMRMADNLSEMKIHELSSFLGRAMANYAKNHEGNLVFEWTLEHTFGLLFEELYLPKCLEIHKALGLGGFTSRSKYEYQSDCEAFVVPHEKPVFAFGKVWHDSQKNLFVHSPCALGLFDRSHIRKIWKRTKKKHGAWIEHPTLKTYQDLDFEMRFNEGPFRMYGDCRDEGHVLTWEKNMMSKCDKPTWSLGDHLQVLFEINSLHNQLVKGE